MVAILDVAKMFVKIPAACIFLLLFASSTAAPGKGAFSGSPPNVLFILADDLGYNELGYMNSSRGLKTPNIDELAKTGVALKNYYVEPICSPTRSALMTGKYPLRLGTQANVIYWDTPWSIGLEHAFIPEHLKAAGYQTAMHGKWHLGMHRNASTPWERGFDEHSGYLQGCGSSGTHISACCSASNHPAYDDEYVCKAPRESKDYRGFDWFSNQGKPDFQQTGRAQRN